MPDNWWEEEDDDDDENEEGDENEDSRGKNTTTAGSSTQHTTKNSQTPAVFVCPECSAVDNYYTNPVSGNCVCMVCKTEASNTQEEVELDVEEAVITAAKTRHGGLFRARKSQSKSRVVKTKPLPNYAAPLPTAQDCIAGVRCVLGQCIDIVYQLAVSNGESDVNDCDNDGDNEKKKLLEETVQAFWLGYLRAWSDGAEHYGRIYPHMRFSFRDLFLFDGIQNRSVQNTLVHKARQRLSAERIEQKANQDDDSAGRPSSSLDDLEDEASEEGCDREEGSDSEDDSERGEQSAISDSATYKDDPIASNTSKPQRDASSLPCFNRFVHSTMYTSCVTLGAMLRKTVHKHAPLAYREAALLAPPDMALLAAILWMSLVHSGLAVVTVSEMYSWIRNGHLPLTNAFNLSLTSELRSKLAAVASFFRVLPQCITTEALESAAFKLVIAARMHRSKAPVVKKPYRHCIQLAWNPQTLPIVLTKMVFKANLKQNVLDRTLHLIGLHDYCCYLKPDLQGIQQQRARQIVTPEYLTSTAELLALIGIAVQLDPRWRSWEYCFGEDMDNPMVPLNESEEVLSDPLDVLEYTAKYMYTQDSDCLLPEGWTESDCQLCNVADSIPVRPVRSNTSSAEHLTDVAIKPCAVVAGRRPPTSEIVERPRTLDEQYRRIEERPNRAWVSYDFHRHRLVEYLAYTAGVQDVHEILYQMDRFTDIRNRAVMGIEKRKRKRPTTPTQTSALTNVEV